MCICSVKIEISAARKVSKKSAAVLACLGPSRTVEWLQNSRRQDLLYWLKDNYNVLKSWYPTSLDSLVFITKTILATGWVSAVDATANKEISVTVEIGGTGGQASRTKEHVIPTVRSHLIVADSEAPGKLYKRSDPQRGQFYGPKFAPAAPGFYGPSASDPSETVISMVPTARRSRALGAAGASRRVYTCFRTPLHLLPLRKTSRAPSAVFLVSDVYSYVQHVPAPHQRFGARLDLGMSWRPRISMVPGPRTSLSGSISMVPKKSILGPKIGRFYGPRARRSRRFAALSMVPRLGPILELSRGLDSAV